MAADQNTEIKQDLVTAYKILVNEGILDGFGHISVRSAKDPAVFLIPRAMPPSLVTEGDILEVRVSDSQPIDPQGRRVNGERYIHGEIYKARADVNAVIHSHTQAVLPLSMTSIPMKPCIVQAGFLPPETPNFELRDHVDASFRGLQVTTAALGAALARTLGPHPVALLRGHGNVVVGTSVKQAVVQAIYTDINARVQMQAMMLSPNIVTMIEREGFTPAEFDVNRPWQHYKHKLLDDAAKTNVDRSQFGLSHTQALQ